jgi:hypothetical protein
MMHDTTMDKFGVSHIKPASLSHILERKGDLLLGIKNNERFGIKLSFYIRNKDAVPLETLIIEKETIAYLSLPILLIKLFPLSEVDNTIYYKCEKCENSSSSTSQSWWEFLTDPFSQRTQSSPIDFELVYGYVTKEWRTLLTNNCYYNIDDTNHHIILYTKNGRIATWIYQIAWFCPDELDPTFMDNYLNAKYKSDDEIFSEFRRLNTHWIELKRNDIIGQCSNKGIVV